MSENKRKVSQMEKVIDAGHNQIAEWHAVILDEKDGRYYENDLRRTRRLLTDEELAKMREPGHGLIVLRLVDAPIPEENKREVNNDRP